jgi:WD40 repeat protein
MSSSTKPRIFVSYARADGVEPARRIRQRLEAAGFSLWQDLAAMEGGRDWWTQIEEAIRARSVEHLVLVVTPSVPERPVVRREVRLARQEGVQVTPVVGADTLDFSKLPRWIGHLQDLSYPEQWERLLIILKGPSTQRRVPFMAPDLPEGFVPRTVEFEALKAKLLDVRGDAVGITAAFRGAGGYGKTVLSNALCHDIDIQDAYFDGILRVELGERVENLLGLVSDLIKMITSEPEGFNTIDAAASRLSEALGDRRFLLVVDDVWREQDLRPFLRGGPSTTRLVTTRMDNILPIGTARVTVDAMRKGEALSLLARGLPGDQVSALRPELATLATRLGEWPFLLALVNGFLRERTLRASEPLTRALDGVGHRLDARGLVAFDPKDEGARGRARTIGVSVELLEAAERQRFGELAVFPEDTDVPIGIIVRLWRETGGFDEFDAEDLLLKLFGLSLVLGFDLERRTFRLHDVVRSYLLTTAGKGGMQGLHGTLAGELENKTGEAWSPMERDYVYRHLPMHLVEAGERAKVDRLLLDVDWMSAKLRTCGPQSLISDYRNLGKGRAQDLIGRVLDLSAGILARDSTQLLAQMLARLAPSDAEAIEVLLAQVAARLPLPALLTKRPTFTAPGAEIRRFEGHEAAVTGVVVLDPECFISSSYDRTLRLWDVATACERRRFQGHEGKVHCLVRLDDRHVASGSEDKTIRLWDVETGTEVRRIEGHEGQVTCLAILDGRILSGSTDKTLRLWHPGTGAEERRFEGHEDSVTCIAVAGDTILSAAFDKTLRLWNAATGAQLCNLVEKEKLQFPIWSIAVLDGHRAVTGGSDDGILRLWDIGSGRELKRIKGIRSRAWRLARLDSRRLAVTTLMPDVEVWDIVSDQLLHRFGPLDGPVYGIAQLDDQHVLSGGWDATIRLWTDKAAYQLQRSSRPEWRVTSFVVLDDQRVVSGSPLGVISLRNPQDGHDLLQFDKAHDGWVSTIARIDEHRVVSAGSKATDKSLRLWDIGSGKELRHFEGHHDGVMDVIVVDARRMVSASLDKTLRVWEIESGTVLARLEGHEGKIFSVARIDTRQVISASEDRTLRLWDLQTSTELRRIAGHDGGVYCVAALDTRHVISGSEDRTLRLWDLETSRELLRFTGHDDHIYDVVLLDSQHVVSASLDNTLRLWSTATGKELARIEGDGAFTFVSVMPDADNRSLRRYRPPAFL